MLANWIKKYINYGKSALENNRKPGNPIAKYQRKKHLTDIEKLELENFK